MFSNKENKYSLVINKCDLSDSGEYKAILKNIYGEVQCKCILNISAPLSDDESEPTTNAPNFVELLKDITVFMGQDVCFKCKVTGVPQPELKWFKDGNPIKEANNIKVGLIIILFGLRVIVEEFWLNYK